jgi:hypothetical protein
LRARAAAQQLGEALRRVIATRHADPYATFATAAASERLLTTTTTSDVVVDDKKSEADDNDEMQVDERVSQGALQRALEHAGLGFAPSDVAAAVSYAADESGMIVTLVIVAVVVVVTHSYHSIVVGEIC